MRKWSVPDWSKPIWISFAIITSALLLAGGLYVRDIVALLGFLAWFAIMAFFLVALVGGVLWAAQHLFDNRRKTDTDKSDIANLTP